MATVERLSLQIERITDRLERLAGKPQTEKRLARIEKQTQKLLRKQARLDAITGEEVTTPIAANVLPSDSFEISVTSTRLCPRVDVEIYDSPFDDLFTGGEPLRLRASATGRIKENGGRSTYTSTGTLANGEYWDGLNRQTVFTGSSTWDAWRLYPDLTISVLQGDDVLASQDFATADIFG